MIIYCQLGWKRNIKGGQLINIYHNNTPIDMTQGDYLSAQSDRNKEMWMLRPIECQDGDIIIIDCKVGLRGLGTDEHNTFTATFQVDKTIPNNTFEWHSVAYRGFPLLKGKFKQISVLTAKELKEATIKSKISGS